MKKYIVFFLTAYLSLVILSVSAFAEESVGDFVFEPSPFGSEQVLIKCNSQDETVVIPSEYNGITVRATDFAYYRIFKDCMSAKKIVLPDTLLSCGNKYSFVPYTSDGINSTYGEIEFNQWGNGEYLGTADNPYYALVGVIDVNITEFVMHNDAEIIGHHAFYGCEQLRKITVSENLKSISENGLQLSYEEHYYDSRLEYNEYGNCLYLGTADNPYYALIKPVTEKVDGQEIRFKKPAGIHPDTEFIGRFYNGLSDTELVIPKSVKAMGWYALSNAENAKVYFEADGEDALLYPLYNPERSDSVELSWGYVTSQEEPSSVDSSSTDESDDDVKDNDHWVYISVAAAAVILLTAVLILKGRKNSK